MADFLKLRKLNNSFVIGSAAITLFLATQPFLAFAKIKLPNLSKVKPSDLKPADISFVKGISGQVSMTLKQDFQLTPGVDLIQFQNGKISEEVEFYQSPRCYLHLRKAFASHHPLVVGQVLKVSKIDNIYTKGSVHVTFWFDQDPAVSDLACITNYNHTMTVEELKTTLGSLIQVSFPKSIVNKALFNTAPVKGRTVLLDGSLDGSSDDYRSPSARVILSDS